MNKNHIISALVILTLIGALSGSVSHMKAKLAEDERDAAVSELTELKSQKNVQVDEILGKSAQLQADLQERDKQLRKAREELIELRRSNKSLESDISARNVALQKIDQEKNALMNQLAEVRAALEKQKRMGMAAAGGAGNEPLTACEKKLGRARAEIAQLKIAVQRKVQQIANARKAAATSVDASNEIKSLRKELQGAKAAGEADVLVFLDGDRSDDPRQLEIVAAPVLDDRADLVIGSRIKGTLEKGAMPLHGRLGNRFIVSLLKLLYGVNITDIGSFRAIKRQTLFHLKMEQMTYGWPVEMVVKGARMGLRVQSVPINYRKRVGKSKVTGTLRGTILATYYMFLVPLKYLFIKS
jgi:hypothetical protein